MSVIASELLASVTWLDGLPVTTVERTVADLAAVGIDQDHLAGVVHDALASGAGASRLADALEPRAATFGHEGGQAYLMALLDAAGYEPDPVMAATVRRFSDAMAISHAADAAKHGENS